MSHGALCEEVKPPDLKISWVKTKVQVLGSQLDETVYCSVFMDVARTLKP